MNSRAPVALLTFACTLLGGCASAGVGSSEGCRSDLPPHEDPMTELVDSAALQQSAEGLWPEVDGLVLASVSYDSLGVIDTVIVRTESMSDAARERLEEALLASARGSSGPDETVDLFIGDGDGPAVRRVAGFRACRPRLLNGAVLTGMLQRGARPLGIQERRVVVLLALVLRDGTVGEVRVAESSGDHRLDSTAAETMRLGTFSPAMIEGLRYRVWIQVPLTYTPPGNRD